jgi:hypothetical protein
LAGERLATSPTEYAASVRELVESTNHS